MTCNETKALIDLFVAGDLQGIKRRRFQTHLLECKTCYAQLREARICQGIIDDYADHLKASGRPLRERILDRIAEERPPGVPAFAIDRRQRRADRRGRWLGHGGAKWVLFAATLLFAVSVFFIGSQVFRRQTSEFETRILAQVARIEGQVRKLEWNEGGWRESSREGAIRGGQMLESGPGGEVVLNLADGSRARFDGRGSLEFREDAKEDLRTLVLTGGRLQVSGARSEDFSVETPKGRVTVESGPATFTLGERELVSGRRKTASRSHRGDQKSEESGAETEEEGPLLILRRGVLEITTSGGINRITAPVRGRITERGFVSAPIRGRITERESVTAPIRSRTTERESVTAPIRGRTTERESVTAPDRGRTTERESVTAPGEISRPGLICSCPQCSSTSTALSGSLRQLDRRESLEVEGGSAVAARPGSIPERDRGPASEKAPRPSGRKVGQGDTTRITVAELHREARYSLGRLEEAVRAYENLLASEGSDLSETEVLTVGWVAYSWRLRLVELMGRTPMGAVPEEWQRSLIGTALSNLSESSGLIRSVLTGLVVDLAEQFPDGVRSVLGLDGSGIGVGSPKDKENGIAGRRTTLASRRLLPILAFVDDEEADETLAELLENASEKWTEEERALYLTTIALKIIRNAPPFVKRDISVRKTESTAPKPTPKQLRFREFWAGCLADWLDKEVVPREFCLGLAPCIPGKVTEKRFGKAYSKLFPSVRRKTISQALGGENPNPSFFASVLSVSRGWDVAIRFLGNQASTDTFNRSRFRRSDLHKAMVKLVGFNPGRDLWMQSADEGEFAKKQVAWILCETGYGREAREEGDGMDFFPYLFGAPTSVWSMSNGSNRSRRFDSFLNSWLGASRYRPAAESIVDFFIDPYVAGSRRGDLSGEADGARQTVAELYEELNAALARRDGGKSTADSGAKVDALRSHMTRALVAPGILWRLRYWVELFVIP